MSLDQSRLLLTLNKELPDTRPIWVMRQAGRYLPEFKALRKKMGSFMDLCRNPEASCEATMQPLARYDLDAAIIFSDILVIPDAMGAGLHFLEGTGPAFNDPFEPGSKVPELDSDLLQYVYDAIALTRKTMPADIPLFGFAGSPWTLFTYMIPISQGEDRRNRAKAIALSHPEWTLKVLDTLANAVSIHLKRQIQAGANVVQLFDSWGGTLSLHHFRAFSLPFIQKVIDEVQGHAPIVLFVKGGHESIEGQVSSNPQAIGVDWTSDLGYMRDRVAGACAIQGNLDPAVLLLDPDKVYHEATFMLKRFGPGPGHIVNLGHGITPQANPESMTAFIQAVRDYKLGKPDQK